MNATETYSDTASSDARTASDVICLAATPVFALMAMATGLGGGDMPGMAMASPLNGMTAMYALMSVFHAAPWLKLIARRNSQPIHHS